MKDMRTTLRQASRFNRDDANCSIMNRTLNGASQGTLNQGYKAGNQIKNANLKPKIFNLKLTVLPYFCPRLIYGRNNINIEACGYKIF